MCSKPKSMMKPKWQWLARGDQGFTLFEVVVAGFVAILFFLLVLQASSVGSISKAQAQEASEVLSWLQKDMESVKQASGSLQLATIKAANKDDTRVYLTNFNDEKKFTTGDIIEFITANPDGIRYTIKSANSPTTGYFRLVDKLKVTYPPNSIVHVLSRQEASIVTSIPLGSNTVYVTNTGRLNPGDKLTFGQGIVSSSVSPLQSEVSQEDYSISAVSSGAITLKQNLLSSLDSTNSVNVSPCNPSHKDLGYADALRDELIGVDESTDSSIILLDTTTTKTSKGKQYMVKRIMELVDIPPYNMLQVRYETSPVLSKMISLDSFVNRIMPDIVFYCN